jgi:hypothetical protein
MQCGFRLWDEPRDPDDYFSDFPALSSPDSVTLTHATREFCPPPVNTERRISASTFDFTSIVEFHMIRLHRSLIDISQSTLFAEFNQLEVR